MHCVCYVGNGKQKTKEHLLNRLKKSFNVIRIDRKEVELDFEKENTEFETVVFVDLKGFKKIKFESCIIVFSEGGKIEVPDIYCNNVVGIVSSNDKHQLDELLKLEIPVITCGGLSKDTVTYSSVADESVLVSLQRTIETVSGNKIEPFDLPVDMSDGESMYGVLSSIAICLELGCFDKYSQE